MSKSREKTGILPDTVILAILRTADPSLDLDDEDAVETARKETHDLRRKLEGRAFNSEQAHVGLDANGGLLGMVTDTDANELRQKFAERLAGVVTINGMKRSRELERRAVYRNQPDVEDARFTKGRASALRHRPYRASWGAGNTGYVLDTTPRDEDPFQAVTVTDSKVVLDTCCVIAGVVESDPGSEAIVRLARMGKVKHFGTERLQSEFRTVIDRGKTGDDTRFDPHQSHILHWFKREMNIVPEPEQRIPLRLVGRHTGDLAPLQSALSAGTSLVTLDIVHLLHNTPAIKEKLGIDVFSPKEWLETMAPAVLGILREEE